MQATTTIVNQADPRSGALWCPTALGAGPVAASDADRAGLGADTPTRKQTEADWNAHKLSFFGVGRVAVGADVSDRLR